MREGGRRGGEGGGNAQRLSPGHTATLCTAIFIGVRPTTCADPGRGRCRRNVLEREGLQEPDTISSLQPGNFPKQGRVRLVF